MKKIYVYNGASRKKHPVNSTTRLRYVTALSLFLHIAAITYLVLEYKGISHETYHIIHYHTLLIHVEG